VIKYKNKATVTKKLTKKGKKQKPKKKKTTNTSFLKPGIMTKKRTDTWNKNMTSFNATSKVRLLRQKLVCYVANFSGRVCALT
jgi:hypothetical protein